MHPGSSTLRNDSCHLPPITFSTSTVSGSTCSTPFMVLNSTRKNTTVATRSGELIQATPMKSPAACHAASSTIPNAICQASVAREVLIAGIEAFERCAPDSARYFLLRLLREIGKDRFLVRDRELRLRP